MLDFSNNVNIDEVLAEVDFPVELQPIYDGDKPISKEMGQFVRRTDTDDLFGIVKSKYKLLSHKDAFGGALEAMQTALDFSDAQIKVTSYENGALAMMEIMFPNHHAKVGDHDLYLKYVARNSYNLRWKFQSFFGWLNQVCFNTLVSGQQLAYSSHRHTVGFDVQSANAKIQKAVTAVTQDTEMYNKWWNTKVSDEQVVDLFKSTLGRLKVSASKIKTGRSHINQKCVNTLCDLYEKEVAQIHGSGAYGRNGAQGSLWCVYQAVTEWSTHLRDCASDTSKKHIVQQQRQDEIKSMLNSQHWAELVA